MREKKIPIKNIYLLFTISLGLIFLGIGSTYAVFTAEAKISSPISLSSNLTYDSSLMETINITVGAGERVNSNLIITNNSGNSVNYAGFYIDDGLDISVGTFDVEPSGVLENGESITLEATVKNNTDNEEIVVLGILSSSDSLVFGNRMKTISRILEAYEFSYDNSNTGVDCTDVQCMIDFLSE